VTESPTIRGLVAKLITDDELAINRGSRDGVKKGMYFNILDESTDSIHDPETGEDLGSITRIKAQVEIISVSDRLSLGAIYPSRPREGFNYTIDSLMGPRRRSGTLTSQVWPEGVKVGDPVVYVTGPLRA
jgi:hypothetical protein